MRLVFEILRRNDSGEEPRLLRVPYETDSAEETVASALTAINADPARVDAEGETFEPIGWECSCLQKKCGACAMRINGTPRLACDARLSELGATVRLEPLAKFPLVRDLITDRSILRENLKEIGAWFEDGALSGAEEMAYEASRCLQCGICLEICPNFYSGGSFHGMAAQIPTSRVIAELPPAQKKNIYEAYRRHIYNGCGKSLACRDVCPAGIDIDSLLVKSNALAIWKRKR